MNEADSGNGDSVREYVFKISRLTVDKLGVKLYDKASAVVSELIANSYDADAEKVEVKLPLSSLLTHKIGGVQTDAGYVVEVVDDGHGMTPDEAIDFYLMVGQDRRKNGKQGGFSRNKKRAVMGRKGIGKLAPFGICKKIEIISAGGEETADGFLVTHFTMNSDEIITDSDEDLVLEPGEFDRIYYEKSGTTVRLSVFLPKRVPRLEIFHRQLASRFIFADSDFKIRIEDTRNPADNPPVDVQPFEVPVVEKTRIDLSNRPVPLEDEEGNIEELQVTGWLAMAKSAYKNEEATGVRIYARNKIVARTRDFEQPAGFTGEFTVRSYLVGEVNAEWLDHDDGEDLIRSDRQGILWESEFGNALRKWGAELIKEIGAQTAAPRRESVSKQFMSRSNFEEEVKTRYTDTYVINTAIDLAKRFGGFAAEDELQHDDYVRSLRDLIIAIAPHQALMVAFQKFAEKVGAGNPSFDSLIDLFGKTQIAELASYAQIARERVQVIEKLERLVIYEQAESKLQELIASAPWLIEPYWNIITSNQWLKTFKTYFEKFWKEKYGEELNIAISHETKRPDFTAAGIDHRLYIVEIKAPGHQFNDEDFERLINYVDAFDEFFENNPGINKEYSRGWKLDLIADGIELKKSPNSHAFKRLEEKEQLRRQSWLEFIALSKKTHDQFLTVHDEATKIAGDLE